MRGVVRDLCGRLGSQLPASCSVARSGSSRGSMLFSLPESPNLPRTEFISQVADTRTRTFSPVAEQAMLPQWVPSASYSARGGVVFCCLHKRRREKGRCPVDPGDRHGLRSSHRSSGCWLPAVPIRARSFLVSEAAFSGVLGHQCAAPPSERKANEA